MENNIEFLEEELKSLREHIDTLSERYYNARKKLDSLKLEEKARKAAAAGSPTEESREAFKAAIAAGKLSDNPKQKNYAGYYMYMGRNSETNQPAFKHIETRKYLK